MLSKNVEVTPDGRYVRKPGTSEKASYGTMILVRAYIVANAAAALAKGLTITVRYSAGTAVATSGDGNGRKARANVRTYDACWSIAVRAPSAAPDYPPGRHD